MSPVGPVMRVLVVSDDPVRSAGHLDLWLAQRDAHVERIARDDVVRPARRPDADLVIALGSRHSAHEPARADRVRAEVDLLRVAFGSGVPVLGIGHGAHVAARALGGTSYRADRPLFAWRRVDTHDPVLCPEGPWAHAHRDVFAPAPTSTVLGSTWEGPQCFVDDSWPGRVLAWQFHPEATLETMSAQLAEDAVVARRHGADVDALLADARRNAASRRRAALTLFDAAAEALGVRRDPP